MHLQTFVTLVGKTYAAEVSVPVMPDNVSPWTGAELDALGQFGGFSVQCGGVFVDGELTFTLPLNAIMFPGYFPARQTFHIEDVVDADLKAVLWVETVRDRIEAGMEALRSTDVGAGLGLRVEVIDTTPAP